MRSLQHNTRSVRLSSSQLPPLTKAEDAETGQTRISVAITEATAKESALDETQQPRRYKAPTMADIDARGSQLEPVKKLQTIFSKKTYKDRNPCSNFLMEKYKHQRVKSMKTGV